MVLPKPTPEMIDRVIDKVNSNEYYAGLYTLQAGVASYVQHGVRCQWDKLRTSSETLAMFSKYNKRIIRNFMKKCDSYHGSGPLEPMVMPVVEYLYKFVRSYRSMADVETFLGVVARKRSMEDVDTTNSVPEIMSKITVYKPSGDVERYDTIEEFIADDEMPTLEDNVPYEIPDQTFTVAQLKAAVSACDDYASFKRYILSL